MSLIELLPAVHALPRADKLRLMQVLVTDIAAEEEAVLPTSNVPHAVWTPYNAYDAAATLLSALDEDRATAV